MLKEYSISDILALPSQHIPYYAGTFEETEDPEIEWPHRHTFYSLVWFTVGTGFYVIDFEEFDIKPDRIFFVTPKQIHNWDYSENCGGYILTVDNSFAAELDMDYAFPFLDIDVGTKELLHAVFQNTIVNFQQSNNLEIDILYLHQIIGHFASRSQHKSYKTMSSINHFKRLVSEEYRKTTSIEEYAAILHISAEELNSLCKQTTGITAKQFILDLKVTEAKRLLLYSSQNINEIAFNLGFEDSSYFSRIFKKKATLSPSDFLKKYRK